MKLSFFPMLIFSGLEYVCVGKTFANFIFSKMVAIIFSIVFTVVSFYTYSGVIGEHILIVDIVIFILSIIFGELIAYYLIKSQNFSYTSLKNISMIILIVLLVCFIYFTNNQPDLNIFISPE